MEVYGHCLNPGIARNSEAVLSLSRERQSDSGLILGITSFTRCGENAFLLMDRPGELLLMEFILVKFRSDGVIGNLSFGTWGEDTFCLISYFLGRVSGISAMVIVGCLQYFLLFLTFRYYSLSFVSFSDKSFSLLYKYSLLSEAGFLYTLVFFGLVSSVGEPLYY